MNKRTLAIAAAIGATTIYGLNHTIAKGVMPTYVQPLGFIILEAHDGENCLRILEELPGNRTPDLFLLDISMPGINGLELAAQLRQKNIQSPIVMLSADAQEHNRSPEYKAAFNDYLVKPVSNSVLLKRLGEQLDLEWVYQAEDAQIQSQELEKSEQRGQQKAEQPQPVPPAADESESNPLCDHPLLHELKAFAEMGYKKGVQRCLEQLRSEISASQYDNYKQLADSFRFPDLATKLTQDLSGPESPNSNNNNDNKELQQ